MVQIPQWKIILILLVCAFGFLYTIPNFMGKDANIWVQENLPGWLPTKTVNLGLDLQGGSHLLLDVDVNTVLRKRAEDLQDALRPALREERIGYRKLSVIPNGVRVTIRDKGEVEKAELIASDLEQGLDVSLEGQTLSLVYTEDALETMRDQIIEQSIEVVRRRIDETGTREPTIQRQGDTRILVQVPGLEDPERLKELLKQTAQLTFHMVDATASGNLSAGARSMILPLQGEPGQSLAIERRELLTGSMLTNAQFAQDQNGQPAISFRLNGVGAKRFCDISRENVGRPFAIVIDREIISAPVIREAICGGAGQISGNFSIAEANDLALLLRAGALPASLDIVEERTVGPSLGADSVEAGKKASLVGLFLILVFMGFSYGLFGLFANVALIVNVALIFSILSGLQATLTLPGIAGIVLTVGMAVDANVLIFERIREEIRNGRSPISAIDAGYSRAMGTIIDSNLTTLIAALILFSFGTGPIKGFAVTLGIGIMTSFFSAIMVTRLLVVTWLRNKKPTELPV